MSGRRSQSALHGVLFFAALVAVGLGARTARAEELIIKRAGDHPAYSVEIEPHLTLAFLIPSAGSSGIGLGGRFTIPIVKNGFISSINNSVGIGLGLDWVHYNGCYAHWGNAAACSNLEVLYFPIVMQWNFFLSTHWSVFAEPGLAITNYSYGSCVDAPGVVCGNAPNSLGVDPLIFFAGGRYHFSGTTSLTMRIGWPYMSVGVSFMP
jgi:hypothetical protein